jgi:uncharacterized protein
MKWQGRKESDNVEDGRSSSGGGGGFGGGLPGGLLTKGGLGTIVVVLLISWVTGTNPLSLLQQTDLSGGGQVQQSSTGTFSPEEEELAKFVSVILRSTEEVWHQQLPDYRNPTLRLFTGQIQSGCGSATSSSGPFYCSQDEKVYIDLSFYQELKDQLNAPGDFAQAYVIAHEVGHHIQHMKGITDKVHEMRSQLSEEEYNKLSVKLELQADFLAGVWAYHAKDDNSFIEPEDFQEAINAATAIGDDHLQKQFQGQVIPDSFTHGTSAQRVKWFTKGFQTGDINQGDTFSATDL